MKRLIASILLFSLQMPVLAADVSTSINSQTTEQTQTSTLKNTALSSSVIDTTQVITEPENLIDVERTPIVLHSHLKKHYSAFKITIVDKYPGKLDLYLGVITNGFSGTQASEASSLSNLHILWGLPLGLLGLGVAAVVVTSRNGKARGEGAVYANRVPNTTLNNGDTLSFTTLIPVGQTPKIRLSLKDAQTNLQFTKIVN